ncbi:LysR family transcriptional regulator [Flavobacterium aciduliphilum]|uniref:DNA-binding transcriptional LysR family regulator n=1 Tax=Flavobacterium aciduliphilum TaxID=1101402 RepID=A0A328YD48_9FLAO|nr:LysR family transcriptional regulator [Flavobacterium aciduliphilum]RAR70032.1 DNA-binding transcriptional LysR family regulator [Flavobacterium aciduliphilum]
MNYTLHQLQVFLKITQTKSITKAAEALHLTQPAVSIQLKNFQDQFDIPLTEVVGRQLYITDFGKEISNAAENIINEVNAINYKTLSYKGILSGKLKISIVSTGKYVMPFFLTDFIKSYSNIEFEIDVTNKSKVIRALQNNEVDFALVSLLPHDFNVEAELLMENKLYLVGNKDFMEHYEEEVLEHFLLNVPFIYREMGSATRLAMENYLERNNIKPISKIQLTSNEAVKQAVIAGLGVSIMPLIGLKNEIEKGEIMIAKAKKLPIVTNWNLIWLKGKKMSPVAQEYLNFIKSTKEYIHQTHFSWIDSH